MKIFFFSFFTIILSIVGLLAYFGHPWSISESSHVIETINVEPEGMVDSEEHPSVIKVLTWNLGFLFGEGSEGDGYEPQSKDFYINKLNELVTKVKEWDPDIILFQEIDFESSRSRNLNQAQYVAKKAGYPFIAEAVSWEANYIPFPYWPVAKQFGRMKSGGAILSKYPVTDHEVILLAKPASQPWWYNIFYLHRYFQKATIEIDQKKYQVINLHLEAFDKKDREGQIKKLVELVKKENIDIIAGDFNMVPTSAAKKSKFKNKDDYENDSSFEIMQSSGLQEVIPEDIYSKTETSYFTYPSSHPDRRLDYIFYRSGLKMMKAEVLPSALSDHLPLRATFQIGSPKVNPYSL